MTKYINRNIFLSVVLALILCSCSKEKRANEAALKMQQFVVDISQYARSLDPDFVIIPQNGPELAFNDAEPENELNQEYLAAIDGMGMEEIFYFETFSPDEYRLDMLRKLVPLKKIMVSEFVNSASLLPDALQRNYNEGFICFVRNSDNYYYTKIPDTIPFENSNNISTLADAQNYLYIINSENYASKQNFLSAIDATNFDVILIDLFFEETAFTTAEINELKTKANGAQRLVIAYMNVGSAENYRYYWQDDWKLHNPNWIKKKYDGYEDEFWVEFWNEDWQKIIFGNNDSYTKKIIDAGFDGAYLDNVEAYYFLYFND